MKINYIYFVLGTFTQSGDTRLCTCNSHLDTHKGMLFRLTNAEKQHRTDSQTTKAGTKNGRTIILVLIN